MHGAHGFLLPRMPALMVHHYCVPFAASATVISRLVSSHGVCAPRVREIETKHWRVPFASRSGVFRRDVRRASMGPAACPGCELTCPPQNFSRSLTSVARVLHAARCVAAQFMRHALCGTSQAFHAWRIHLDAHKKIAALSTTARTRALMAAFVHWTTHVDIERELERFLEMPRRCHVHRGLGGR